MKRLMKGFGFLVAILLAAPALGQTPAPHPDVLLEQSGGVYPIGCHSADDGGLTAELCFARVDLPVVLELGCLEAGSNEAIHTTVTVPTTPGEDAEVRCYAVGHGALALVSDYSYNAGRIGFTSPGRPRIVATMRAARSPKRLYPSCTERRFEFEVDLLVLWTPRERQPEQIKTLVLAVSG